MDAPRRGRAQSRRLDDELERQQEREREQEAQVLLDGGEYVCSEEEEQEAGWWWWQSSGGGEGEGDSERICFAGMRMSL